jgi:rod shape-determining protein MreD
MKFAIIVLVAAACGAVELVFSWRIAVSGAAPDLLFIAAAFAAMSLRPVERIPVACIVGLWSDFLMGGRLGLMALGYGIGVRIFDGMAPVAGKWARRRRSNVLSSGVAIGMAVFAGAAAAHLVVALLAGTVGSSTASAGARALRAVGIALYSSGVAPVVWIPYAILTGVASRRALSTRPNVLES